jgi:branched-chain amino acid aminotransferase
MRRDDLYLADEAFLTGTAAEVVPISSVDDRRRR